MFITDKVTDTELLIIEWGDYIGSMSPVPWRFFGKYPAMDIRPLVTAGLYNL